MSDSRMRASRARSRMQRSRATQLASQGRPGTRSPRVADDSGATTADPPALEFPDDSIWPRGAGNGAYWFRSRKGVRDLKLTSTDPVFWSSAEDGERNNRADIVRLTLLVTDAQPGSQGVLTFQSSFDGVQFYTKGTSGTIPFFSGQLIVASPAPSDPLGNVLSRMGVQVTSGGATFRAWVTGRPRGCRRFAVVALDRVMDGTGNYYSIDEYNDMFGTVDYLLFQVIAEQVGGGSVTLTVQIEESPDGIIWVNKQATPEINAVSIPVAGGIVAKDDGSVPGSKLTRFRLSLAGTNPIANVKLFVVGRGR